MSALEALLAERSVVLLSSHYSLLTLTAEALLQSIQPFQWNYLYIPVLPIGMLAYLQSPFPLLMVRARADPFCIAAVSFTHVLLCIVCSVSFRESTAVFLTELCVSVILRQSCWIWTRTV